MRRFREETGESSPLPRRLANIGVKQINVFPLIMLLIAVLFLVYWLRPHG